MAKFSGDNGNNYAEMLMGTFYGNSLRNYRGDVCDSDYFIPIGSKMMGTRELEQAIYDRFTADELVDAGVAWFCEDEGREPRNGRKYGEPAMAYKEDAPEETLQSIWNDRKLNPQCRAFLIEVVDAFTEKRRQAAEGDALKGRFEELAKFFKLDDLEISALQYLFVKTSTAFTDNPFSGHFSRGGYQNMKVDFCAMCIDRSVAEVRKLRGGESRLRKYEFVDDDFDLNCDIRSYLNGEDKEPLQGRFFRKARPNDILPWNFYDEELRRHGKVIKRLIRSKKAGRGVNILLYGEPGSGKTSFAATLANDLGLETYEILHSDSDGRNRGLGPRLAGVQVCNEQVPEGNSMMVVDEADQILSTNCGGGFLGLFMPVSRGSSEKGQVNSMLDSMRVPTVWISNAGAGVMDDSVRRRFDYSVRFNKPSHAMRANIWRNNIRKLDLGRLIPAGQVDELASSYVTSAGGISMVLRNLKDMSPKPREVPALLRSLMKPHCELMGTDTKDDFVAPARDYSLEGMNIRGDIGLDRIVEAVGNFYNEPDDGAPDADRPRMNLLFWGPPGTGKTEFAKYLARRLDRPLVVKMGSDLLSKWVGETEQKIRAAFEEAEADNAILLLDEIDGMVQDRSRARHSWEVTQVNELLHRMENFRGVMIGATNFMDNLDPAILRRFTFKLEFGFLDEAGKRLFFERMFRTSLTDAEARRLAGIPNLAPGDYRTVRQALHYLGGAVSNDTRLGELERESSLKKCGGRRIGF
jgi:SpoVK/Ycf46/Vps4 family AAA+-type ATPase